MVGKVGKGKGEEEREMEKEGWVGCGRSYSSWIRQW